MPQTNLPEGDKLEATPGPSKVAPKKTIEHKDKCEGGNKRGPEVQQGNLQKAVLSLHVVYQEPTRG